MLRPAVITALIAVAVLVAPSALADHRFLAVFVLLAIILALH